MLEYKKGLFIRVNLLRVKAKAANVNKIITGVRLVSTENVDTSINTQKQYK